MRKQLIAVFILKVSVGIITLLLFWGHTWALDPDKKIDEYRVDQWDKSQGIPSNTIHSFAQTPDGYLWIATNKGLIRFDGITFSPVTFAEKEEEETGQTAVAEALYLDNSGTLWIGSNVGLTSYDSQTRQFNTYTTAHGLTGGKIRRLLKGIKGNLWIGFVSNHLNRFANGRFTVYNDSHGLMGQKVNAVVEDQTGNLLIGTRDDGVFEYQDGRFIQYPITGLTGYIVHMCEDHSGTLWISTSRGLLKKTGNTVDTYTTKHGLSADLTTYILEDSLQNLWIGTDKGLNRFIKKNGGDVAFEHTLESRIIVCLFEDREGSLWAGTDKSGIIRLKNPKFKSFSSLETYPEEVFFSMHRDPQGDTWIGTANGKLFRFRGNTLVEPIEFPAFSGSCIMAIATDADGDLWVGTNGKGVFHEKNNTFLQFTEQDGLADDFVTTIFLDSRGDTWFGTDNGISVLLPGEKTFHTLNPQNGLKGKKVYCICEDNAKHIWIGTDNGVTVLKDGKIDAETMSHHLENIPVTWVYEDPAPPEGEGGVFWIATYGAGLKRLRLKDHLVTTYTKDQGMATNSIFRFFEDKQGNFWFMSNSGILRIGKSELDCFARKEVDRVNCISFDEADGLIDPEFNNPFSRHTAFDTETGELWFLSNKGISFINPGTIRINKFPPPVVIEEAFFNREFIPLPLANNETFEDINDIRFRFTATTLLSAEKVIFKYRLEGFEEKWNFLAPGGERAAHYKNLEPGTYTFRVTACNAEGVWNTAGTSVTFTLATPFVKTLLFKIIVFLLFIGLLAAVYIYKKRPSREKVNEEGKTVEDEAKVSPLPRPFVEECTRKLRHLMEVEKVYRDETLTVRSLAEKVSIPYYQLSQVLNDALNRSFPDFINYYRIEEAKEILKGPEEEMPKITALAHQVGFNSMTAFYKAFKKLTDMTPNQYKEEGRGKNTPRNP